MNKFRLQVIVPFILLIGVTVTTIISINYHSFSNESLTLNKYILTQQADSIAKGVNNNLSHIKDLLGTITIPALDAEIYKPKHDTIIQIQCLYEAHKNYTEGLFIVSKDGRVWDKNGRLQEFNAKTLNKEYYKELFYSNKKVYLTKPYISKSTGNSIIGLVVKAGVNSAILTNLTLDTLIDSTETNMFIYDSNGLIIKAPYKEYFLQNIYTKRPDYKKFNTSNKSITYETVVRGTPLEAYGFWAKVSDTDWNIVTFTQQDKVRAGVTQNLHISILLVVVLMLISIGIIYYLVNYLVLRKVGDSPENIAAKMTTFSEGDLSEKLDTKNSTGILRSLSVFQTRLRSLIQNVEKTSSKVNQTSSELKEALEITKINSTKESQQVEEIATAINELSATANEVSEKAVIAENETVKTKEAVLIGKDSLDNSVGITEEINKSVEETVIMVENLKHFAEEIGKVTSIISDISDQTNLLALNAAIEAARAGDQGRGFSVIAAEVQTLAKRTQSSTVDIQEIVHKLQDQATLVDSNIKDNVSLIKQSVYTIESVKEAFEEVNLAVESISDINTLVATASQEQSCVTEDISKNITEAFNLVRENATAVEQSLSSSRDLSLLSEEQKEDLRKFKI